jgi:hypothetical protein
MGSHVMEAKHEFEIETKGKLIMSKRKLALPRCLRCGNCGKSSKGIFSSKKATHD